MNKSARSRKTAEQLRSHRWFGVQDLRAFGHRSRAKQMGYGPEDYAGKPVIAILNTWSDINQCHAHFKDRVQDVKRGILQAGGFPLELPAISLSEPFVKPTTMLYRNFLAMETEELLRSHPIDGAVLMGGCDKTTPGLIMGAISMNLPAIFVPAGAMLRGNWQGKVLGSGSDAWKYWAELKAGNISQEDWNEMESGIARSHGMCMTMGTAATMTGVAEAMGFSLPGASSIPAPDANHPRLCAASGRRIVEMVWEDLKPSDIMSADGVDNAIRCHLAMGGSTNAMIHVVAMARRAGIPLTLKRFDELARQIPVLANVRPSGAFLMEDFYYAGGIRALLAQLKDELALDCLTVNGQTLGENIAGAEVYNAEVIHSFDKPVSKEATAILYGNLAPDGAVIKPSAADPRLLKHRGPALAFEDYNHMAAEIDRDDLAVTPDHVLVLKNAGPVAVGMPEWGMLPVPKKLLKQGVRDMMRISDARMSGTSYGACILHVSPEAAIGGPLAFVQTGDMIEVDVEARQLNLRVADDELARRKSGWRQKPLPPRGYGRLFASHIQQAHLGCDFDFLLGTEPLPEPEIH
ncbi:MAG TPA: L-arabinonate dehydratase [Verrucomicrobiae bacterium]|nr:L-arabinonate dehydratase [Verrucomicrobiae bacterium]